MEAGKQPISPLIEALAEAKTRAGLEIHVHSSVKPGVRDSRREALRWFYRHGLDKIGNRAGLLIYLNKRTHKFSIVADIAWDAWIRPSDWKTISEGMQDDLLSTQWEKAVSITVRTLEILVISRSNPREQRI